MQQTNSPMTKLNVSASHQHHYLPTGCVTCRKISVIKERYVSVELFFEYHALIFNLYNQSLEQGWYSFQLFVSHLVIVLSSTEAGDDFGVVTNVKAVQL